VRTLWEIHPVLTLGWAKWTRRMLARQPRAIDSDVAAAATFWGEDPRLVQAIVDAEGGGAAISDAATTSNSRTDNASSGPRSHSTSVVAHAIARGTPRSRAPRLRAVTRRRNSPLEPVWPFARPNRANPRAAQKSQ
jgi:hypothetical protein